MTIYEDAKQHSITDCEDCESVPEDSLLMCESLRNKLIKSNVEQKQLSTVEIDNIIQQRTSEIIQHYSEKSRFNRIRSDAEIDDEIHMLAQECKQATASIHRANVDYVIQSYQNTIAKLEEEKHQNELMKQQIKQVTQSLTLKHTQPISYAITEITNDINESYVELLNYVAEAFETKIMDMIEIDDDECTNIDVKKYVNQLFRKKQSKDMLNIITYLRDGLIKFSNMVLNMTVNPLRTLKDLYMFQVDITAHIEEKLDELFALQPSITLYSIELVTDQCMRMMDQINRFIVEDLSKFVKNLTKNVSICMNAYENSRKTDKHVTASITCNNKANSSSKPAICLCEDVDNNSNSLNSIEQIRAFQSCDECVKDYVETCMSNEWVKIDTLTEHVNDVMHTNVNNQTISKMLNQIYGDKIVIERRTVNKIRNRYFKVL